MADDDGVPPFGSVTVAQAKIALSSILADVCTGNYAELCTKYGVS